jgi:hypothetical protein
VEQQQRERIEWERRLELGQQLQKVSHDETALRELLLPYWGFDHVLSAAALRALLTS